MKRSSRPLLTSVGPRHTQQAKKGPMPSFANFGTHGNGPGCLVPARSFGGVPVGNVSDRNCSHLECSHRNNLYVPTCTKGALSRECLCYSGGFSGNAAAACASMSDRSIVPPRSGGAPPRTAEAPQPLALLWCPPPMSPEAPRLPTTCRRFGSLDPLRTHSLRQDSGVPLRPCTLLRRPLGLCWPMFPMGAQVSFFPLAGGVEPSRRLSPSLFC